jgi:hypothetical protein
MRRYRFEQRGLVDRMGVSLLPLIHERRSLRALDAVPWTSHRAIALQLPYEIRPGRSCRSAARADRRDPRQRHRCPVLERAGDDRRQARQVLLRRTARLGVRDRRQRLRLGQERRQPQRRDARADRARAARSARLAAVFQRRVRRPGLAPRRAAGRARAAADHRRPPQALRGDPRPSLRP